MKYRLFAGVPVDGVGTTGVLPSEADSATSVTVGGEGEILDIGCSSGWVDANEEAPEGGEAVMEAGARLGDDFRSRHTRRTFLNTKVSSNRKGGTLIMKH